jgi:protein tyrosine phosphatase (PTP) superfamily phosphohydrolase (DUF442 family)
VPFLLYSAACTFFLVANCYRFLLELTPSKTIKFVPLCDFAKNVKSSFRYKIQCFSWGAMKKKLTQYMLLLAAPTLLLCFGLQAKGLIKKIAEVNKANRIVATDLMNNINTVQEHVLYRSRQLSPAALDAVIKRFGIRTVINLRGEHPDFAWWRDERDVVASNNAVYYNLGLSASALTSKENILTLLNIYDTAPQPLLIHCQGGADRTGEAAALWVLEKMDGDKCAALQQLSLWFGHSTAKCPHKTRLINWWPGRANFEQFYDQLVADQ